MQKTYRNQQHLCMRSDEIGTQLLTAITNLTARQAAFEAIREQAG
jgi:hypothetical protein